MRRITTIGLCLVLIFPLALYAWLQTAAGNDGKIHLGFMAWGTPQQQEGELTVLRMFERKHPKISVDCIFAPGGGYMQKLQLMLASRTEPDVYRFMESTFPQYAALGYFQPLDELIAHDPSYHLSDIVPAALKQMEFGGHLYGLNGIFSARMVYYNKKLFAAAGLADPHDLYLRGQWDLNHFLAAARAITTIDPNTGLARRVGLMIDGQDLYWILWCFGGDVMSEDGKVVIDQPRSIQGMQYYADLEHKYHVIPQPIFIGTAAADVASYNFEAGNVGMMMEWVGAATRFRDIRSFDWDVVPTPVGPAGPAHLVGGNATVLSPHSKHPAEAWELLKFVTSVEAERVFCGDANRRSIPTHFSELGDPAFLTATQPPFHIDAYIAAYQNARMMPVTAKWSYWQEDYDRWMDRMMTDDPTRQVSATAAARGMAQDIRKKLARGEDD
jgi:multiple sugar transport system substrate-binding protein